MVYCDGVKVMMDVVIVIVYDEFGGIFVILIGIIVSNIVIVIVIGVSIVM